MIGDHAIKSFRMMCTHTSEDVTIEDRDLFLRSRIVMHITCAAGITRRVMAGPKVLIRRKVMMIG